MSGCSRCSMSMPESPSRLARALSSLEALPELSLDGPPAGSSGRSTGLSWMYILKAEDLGLCCLFFCPRPFAEAVLGETAPPELRSKC
eukprot:CAMPEP_0172925534 /NCGR_PEP_ID=MMETSP1075-20121228/213888_1 /TAXON_ID=2916 /ORGANISM="Ceratium fusus, Strain PA161109" /LENGTH=87 /DNA_ID=CAMNT_0013786441 /DNA_START=52 /DNA_END=315 /DNA_ORIENTATION=+